MDAAAFEQVYGAFGDFHAYFAPLFGRRETRDHRPGPPAVLRRPGQSEPVPYWIRGGSLLDRPTASASGSVAPCAPRLPPDPPPRHGGAPVPPWRRPLSGPGQSPHPSWPRPHGPHHSAAEPAPVKTRDAPVGLLVGRRPATGHQCLQFLPLLRTQLDTVSLHRHPLLTRPNPLRLMPRRIHLVSTQFKDVGLLEWVGHRRTFGHRARFVMGLKSLLRR